MTSATKILLLGASVGLVLLAGCTGEPADNAPTGPPAATSAPATQPASPTASNATSPTPSGSETPAAGSSGASTETLLRAAKTAQTSVSGAKLTSIESEGTDWVVTVTAADGTESELTVAGDGSSMTQGPRKDNDSARDKAQNATELKGAKLGYADAVGAVEDEVANGIVRQLSLDSEAGKVVWEVKVADAAVDRDLTLDASSGAVLSNKVDD